MLFLYDGYCCHVLPGYTDDVLEYIRVSVPKNMLADLKDSMKNERSLNMQDKYGATAVSLRTLVHTLHMHNYMYMHVYTWYVYVNIEQSVVGLNPT